MKTDINYKLLIIFSSVSFLAFSFLALQTSSLKLFIPLIFISFIFLCVAYIAFSKLREARIAEAERIFALEDKKRRQEKEVLERVRAQEEAKRQAIEKKELRKKQEEELRKKQEKELRKKEEEKRLLAEMERQLKEEEERKIKAELAWKNREEEIRLAENKKREEEREKEIEEYNDIRSKYKNYIEKFFEIAEREVLTLDEWGDENWKGIPKLKIECISRIGEKEYSEAWSSEFEKESRWLNYKVDQEEPYWVRQLYNDLDEDFGIYHGKRKGETAAESEINKMDGVQFEQYVASLLKRGGFNVSGTPKKGDQGADLIASKDSRVFIIQVKRNSGSVGNKAVQEVVAAKDFYNGNSGVVVTNSTFTTSAKELANKNKILLIDKKKLENICSFLTIK